MFSVIIYFAINFWLAFIQHVVVWEAIEKNIVLFDKFTFLHRKGYWCCAIRDVVIFFTKPTETFCSFFFILVSFWWLLRIVEIKTPLTTLSFGFFIFVWFWAIFNYSCNRIVYLMNFKLKAFSKFNQINVMIVKTSVVKLYRMKIYVA